MSVETGRQNSGVVIIGNEPFFLAKDPQSGAPLWQPQQVPTQEGDPTQPRRYRWDDWSRGLGDSRGVFKGSVEHCENAFLGMVGRILPGPKIGTIQTNNDAAILSIEEVTLPANRILAGGGTKVVEVNPADHTVAATQTMPAGAVGPMQLFIDQVAIPLGPTQQFYRRKADGTYAVSTTTTVGTDDYRYADAFGLSGSDLIRGRGAYWSKCAAADFYATNGNWSTEYSIGDLSAGINQVFSHNRWDYVLKDEGLYTFEQATSKEANLLTDLIAFKSGENRQFCHWYDHILVCTYAGLFRYIQQGASRTIGAEEMEINEGVLQNTFPTAAAAFGKWAYVAHYKASTNATYIAMHRRAREGDATLGAPATLVSIIHTFTGRCGAMHISSLGGLPELYFAEDTDLSYFELTRDGRPATYRDSGTAKVWFSPTDLTSPFTIKYFRGIECVGRNAGAGRAIQWKAGMDGAALANVGATITAFTTTFAQRFWTPGSNDSGRVPQIYVEMNLNDPATPPEIRDVALNFEERPVMVEGSFAALRLRDFAEEGDVATRLTAKEQRELLESHIDGPPVLITDPYGETWYAGISQFEGRPGFGDVWANDNYTFAGNMPQETIRVSIRRLDYQ